MTVVAHAQMHVNSRTMDVKRKRGRSIISKRRENEATKHYAKTRVILGDYLDD